MISKKGPFWTIILIAALVLAAAASAAPAILPAPPSPAGWEDPFAGPGLDPRWSWTREDNTHWSLSAMPYYLRITTQTGGLYGTGFYTLPNNLLLTEAPAYNFQATAKVTFSPSQETHTAGLLYYQDDSNYLNMVHVYNFGKWMSFHREIAGTAEYEGYFEQVSDSTVYLRIVRQGNAFLGLFSTGDGTWHKVGDYQLAASFSTPKLGLAAYNGPAGVSEINADFDYIKVEPLQSIYLPAVLK